MAVRTRSHSDSFVVAEIAHKGRELGRGWLCFGAVL